MVVVNNGIEGRCMVGMLTLDIKNAYNSTLWCNIMALLRAKGVSSYLYRL